MSVTVADRDKAFARAVLARKLATREHAEECLKAARDLARRGKPLAIEEIFVRKGYLRRPEAQAIARSLPPPNPKTAKLELAPNVGATPDFSQKLRCPACKKDPGHAEDYCPRCGADLETGNPGPDSTICTACARVVKKGSAVCPRCAQPIERTRLRARGGASWIERLVVLGAVAGCFYFLVYKHVAAPPPLATADEERTPAERAQEALAKDDLDVAARALEEAVKQEGHDPALDRAYVLACLRAGRSEDAKNAVLAARRGRPDDVPLMLLAVEVAVSTSDLEGARKDLALVPEAAHDDAYFRAAARIGEAADRRDELASALEKLKAPTPAETQRLAELGVARARAAIDAGKPDEARSLLDAAATRAPNWAAPRVRLGVLCLKQGEKQLAYVWFQKAIDADSQDGSARLGLAVTLDRQHRKAEALEAYRAFLNVAKPDDSSEDARSVRARIHELEADGR